MKENEPYQEKPDIDITDNLVTFMFLMITRILPIGLILWSVWELTVANYESAGVLLFLGVGILFATSENKEL